MKALKRRLDLWLIAQIQELGWDQQKRTKVNSPFPLAVMTCVACEATGQIFYGARNREGEGVQRDCFVAVAKTLHPHFSRKLAENFHQQLIARWPHLKLEDCSTITHLIYRFFRNSLIHAYRGSGIYITAETETFALDDGFLILNPYWLWEAFRTRYDDLWKEIGKAQKNSPLMISYTAYIEELLR